MYPDLFTVFGFTVSTFGLMLAVAFLVGARITAMRMAEEGLDPDLAWTLLVWVMLGGVAGSKLYFAIDNYIRVDGVAFTDLLLSRGGITWYGGLAGATLAGSIGCRIYDIPVKRMMDCVAVAGAVGQALGRVGCFLVGDDYGKVIRGLQPRGTAIGLGEDDHGFDTQLVTRTHHAQDDLAAVGNQKTPEHATLSTSSV